MAEIQNEKLEIYKIYVQMTDLIGSKRNQSSKFFITALSGIFIGYSFVIEKNIFPNYSNLIQFSISLIGLAVCFLWRTILISYKTLSSAKFKVIHEMEESFPFTPYKKEWEYIKKDKNHQLLTKTEEYATIIFMIPFLILITTSIINHFKC